MSRDAFQEALRLESGSAKKKNLAEAELYRLQAGPERRRELVFARREVFFASEVDEFQVDSAVQLLPDLQGGSSV